VEEFTRQAVVRAEDLERTLLFTSILLTGLATILGLTAALIVTRRLVTGVQTLARGAEAVEAGDLDATVSVRSRDEIGHLATTFNHMVEELRVKERIKETFGRYVDSRIVTKLLDSPQIVEPGGERREMTVMFIDLKNFTSISEKLAGDDLVRLINAFFGHMTEAVTNHDAVVDKFMGDSVMAFWDPPFTGPDEHASLACAAAAEALERLDTFRDEVARDFPRQGDPFDVDLRIGVSTGDVIVGTIGPKVSMSFTVMGDPVKLGARLEAANKAYGTRVPISERTRELAGEDIQAREVDFIRVQGKSRPVRAFELLLPVPGRGLVPAHSLKYFELGLGAYRERDWAAAEAAFRASLEADSKDAAASAYLERIACFRAEPPVSDWDGTWTFLTK
jgi:adenylate cyclase